MSSGKNSHPRLYSLGSSMVDLATASLIWPLRHLYAVLLRIGLIEVDGGHEE